MIGGLGSSLSTALRTAGEARARVDRSTREIATGQRVSSVKDDGAAWARAARQRSDAQAGRMLAGQLDWLRAGVGIHRTSVESRLVLGAMSEHNALRATDPSMSAATRAQIDAQQDEISAQVSDLSPTNHDDAISLIATSGAVWQPSGSSAADANMAWVHSIDGTTMATSWSPVTYQTAIAMNDVSSVANATTSRANRAVRNGEWRTLAQNLAGLDRLLASQGDHIRATADRQDAQAASLTEVDLGKASSMRAQAQARQQLALDTVRVALTAYGQFAGGLLGNVQRTQRAIA
jgi:flagellin